MSKAVETNITTLSRRSALAGLLAIPATTIPAVAYPEHPKLVALGQTFGPLFAAWAQHTGAEHLEQFRYEVEMERRSGVRLVDLPTLHDKSDANRAICQAYYKNRSDLAGPVHDSLGERYQADSAIVTDIEDRLNDLATDILMIDAVTREGVGLQAQALMYLNFDLLEPCIEWGGTPEFEYVRPLLRSLCSFAGLPFPAYQTSAELLMQRDA